MPIVDRVTCRAPRRVAPENGGRSVPHRMALAALVALAALLSTFTIFGTRGVAHLLNLHAQRRALGEHAFALLQGNRILRDRIGRLRGDERYLEALARANLGLVREGEIVYRFTGAAPPAGPP